MPVAEASPCVAVKGGAVAAKRFPQNRLKPVRARRLKCRRGRFCGMSPPGGERSVCGMSGRPNAAVPLRSESNIRVPHAGLVRTPQSLVLDKRKADRKRSRQRRRFPYLEADVSAREGSRGRRDAPRSHSVKNSILRRWNLLESKLKRGTNRRRTI